MGNQELSLEKKGETMSSLEIAQLTGKEHKNLLRDIRNMEVAWKKIAGLKFELTSYMDKSNRKQPMYELTKRECLYIGTKFNDGERAKLVLRWEELENKEQKTLSPAEQLLHNAQILVGHEKQLKQHVNEIKTIKQKQEELEKQISEDLVNEKVKRRLAEQEFALWWNRTDRDELYK